MNRAKAAAKLYGGAAQEGHRAEPPSDAASARLGHVAPLKKGQDLQTLKDNSLALMRAGLSKQDAMAKALNLAGFRPPDSPRARTRE